MGTKANVDRVDLPLHHVVKDFVLDGERLVDRLGKLGFLVNPKVAALSFLSDQGQLQRFFILANQGEPIGYKLRKGRTSLG